MAADSIRGDGLKAGTVDDRRCICHRFRLFGRAFFAIAQGRRTRLLQKPPLPMAARTLGRTSAGVLWSIYVPLMRSSVGTACCLVFVD